MGEAVRPCYAFVRMRRPLSASALAILSSTVILGGCGRKATRADCELIVDRNVEIKLKSDGITDPDVIQQRKAELRAAFKDDIDKCVGKRVTDGMLECAQRAETAEQIDKCIR